MAKRRNGKVRFSAFILRELAIGLQSWLDRNPGSNRTDFVCAALTKKLKRCGIDLSRDSDVQQGTVAVQRARKTAVQHQLPRGHSRDLVTAWVDPNLLTKVDDWIQEVRPQLTRTMFFSEAAAELLEKEGLFSMAQAQKHGAYRDLLRATEDLTGCSATLPPLSERDPRLMDRAQLLAEHKRVSARLKAIDATLKRTDIHPFD
jgi:hypothetical protein